ncbi:hypothetical protein HK101_001772, partial [Irineochytrium annulatum]
MGYPQGYYDQRHYGSEKGGYPAPINSHSHSHHTNGASNHKHRVTSVEHLTENSSQDHSLEPTQDLKASRNRHSDQNAPHQPSSYQHNNHHHQQYPHQQPARHHSAPAPSLNHDLHNNEPHHQSHESMNNFIERAGSAEPTSSSEQPSVGISTGQGGMTGGSTGGARLPSMSELLHQTCDPYDAIQQHPFMAGPTNNNNSNARGGNSAGVVADTATSASGQSNANMNTTSGGKMRGGGGMASASDRFIASPIIPGMEQQNQSAAAAQQLNISSFINDSPGAIHNAPPSSGGWASAPRSPNNGQLVLGGGQYGNGQNNAGGINQWGQSGMNDLPFMNHNHHGSQYGSYNQGHYVYPQGQQGGHPGYGAYHHGGMNGSGMGQQNGGQNSGSSQGSHMQSPMAGHRQGMPQQGHQYDQGGSNSPYLNNNYVNAYGYGNGQGGHSYGSGVGHHQGLHTPISGQSHHHYNVGHLGMNGYGNGHFPQGNGHMGNENASPESAAAAAAAAAATAAAGGGPLQNGGLAYAQGYHQPFSTPATSGLIPACDDPASAAAAAAAAAAASGFIDPYQSHPQHISHHHNHPHSHHGPHSHNGGYYSQDYNNMHPSHHSHHPHPITTSLPAITSGPHNNANSAPSNSGGSAGPIRSKRRKSHPYATNPDSRNTGHHHPHTATAAEGCEEDEYVPSPSSTREPTPRRYLCNVCNKRFTRPSTLRTHMNSHTGERP